MVAVKAQGAADSLQDASLQPVQTEAGQRTAFPASAGVYAVYNKDQRIQYIGLSRKVRMQLCACYKLLPCTHF